jgi:tetratricopeptide (TPR) repeat protein
MTQTTRAAHSPGRKHHASSSKDARARQGAAPGGQSSQAGPLTFFVRHPLVVGLLLMAVTIALYASVHHHPFVNYDDGVYVTVNDHVKAGLTWETVGWAFTTYDAANWHPLTWLSHATDYQMFGENPAGHHADNLLLHAVNVALLFWVLFRATRYLGRSAMVAALFALHPINTETVVWIAERKNLLSMAFFLLALGAYGWYASAERARRLGRYLAVVLLFALALMAKPQVVTFPFVLLLWDYWPLRRIAPAAADAATAPSFSFLLLEKVPFLIMSAVSGLLTVRAQFDGGGFNPDYGLLLRLENAAVSYVRYLGKALWPSQLAPMYPHPGASLPTWQAAAAAIVLLTISALVWRERRRRYLPVGWLWFLGTLGPMIGIVQVGRQAMADRYAYLPFIGLFIMVCWGVAEIAEQRRLAPARIAAASCLALLVLGALTHRQIAYWSDNVTLWTHTTQVTTGNYEAEDNLGEALQKSGRADEALPHFQRAFQIYPAYPTTLMFLAVDDQRDGKLPEAIEKYKEVIRNTDNAVHQNAAIRATAFGNMGHAYRELGNLADARRALQSAVELNQKSFPVWMDLGLVSQRLDDPVQAARAYQQAMRLQPSDVGYILLARALREAGQTAEAEKALQQAKLLTRNYERAQQTAAGLLQEQSQP